MVVNVHARLRPLLTTALTVIKKQEKFPVHFARLLLMMTRRYNVEHVIVIFTTFVPTYKILFLKYFTQFCRQSNRFAQSALTSYLSNARLLALKLTH